VTTYDEIAEWYDAWLGSGPLDEDPFFPTVEGLLGDVTRQRILDLACGQGRVTRHLADQGASVVGVDLSARLLDMARAHEASKPRGIDYRQVDARTLAGFDQTSFDGVLCFMALMDIADLGPTLESVARVLRPGGWFVFAILHPCYNTPRSGELDSSDGLVRTVGSYFVERHWRSDARIGPPGKVGAYHRTLSTYINGLIGVTLRIERIAEPVASGPRAERRPIWTEVPAALIVRSSKA
jgi:SAM-dependent methyltransferase